MPAHVGILQGLCDLDVHFDHLVGISGGSIIGALYSAGKSLDEIRELALGVDFSRFRGQSLVTLIRHGGLSSGNHFEHWMEEQLEGATFRDLNINLHIVATDVRTGSPVIFDLERSPDLKVSKAVRFSMSIPLLFSFKEFGDHLLVDGSILSEEVVYRDWAGDETPVICFRLRGKHKNHHKSKKSLFPLKEYLSLLMLTFMTTMSREYVNEAFWHTTVVVETGDISPVEFNLSRQQKLELYDVGYATTLNVVPNKVLRLHTGT